MIYCEEFFNFIGGVITLVACSDDFSQVNDSNQPSEVVFDDDFKNYSKSGSGYTTNSIAGPYNSAWDVNNIRTVRHYYGCTSLATYGSYVRVTPYIGLAYYDGADDGTYNTPTGAFNINSGAFPNLYAGGTEYGNYIAANPFILGTNAYSLHELAIRENGGAITPGVGDHCQVNNADVFGYNPEGIFFDLQNNHIVQPLALAAGTTVTPPTGSATNAETNLLAQYGKVMYYKIEFSPNADVTNFIETRYVLALQATVSDFPSAWATMSITDTPFGGDLYYHTTTNEIIVDAPSLATYPGFMYSGSADAIFGQARRIETRHYFPTYPDDYLQLFIY